MASSLPALEEIRRVFRLLGECTELGADAQLWREHLTQGCATLAADHFINLVESQPPPAPGQPPPAIAVRFFNGGALPHKRYDLIQRFMETPAEISPIVPALLNEKQPSVTRLRCELVPDRVWQRSVFFQDYLRPLGLGDQITSVELAAPQTVSSICWLSYAKEKCTVRASRLLKFLHQELTRLKQEGKLAPLGGFSLRDLSPRQRELLFGLFEGDSEKQLALRLGLSPHTVHDYLKTLHRRLGVSSRGELLSRCVKYWPALTYLQARSQ